MSNFFFSLSHYGCFILLKGAFTPPVLLAMIVLFPLECRTHNAAKDESTVREMWHRGKKKSQYFFPHCPQVSVHAFIWSNRCPRLIKSVISFVEATVFPFPDPFLRKSLLPINSDRLPSSEQQWIRSEPDLSSSIRSEVQTNRTGV